MARPPARRSRLRARSPSARSRVWRICASRRMEQLIEAKLALGRHAEVVERAGGADRRVPLPRAPARAADARALPLRPPGGRAAGLPGRAPEAGRASWGSSRASGCASSSGRYSRRTPRWRCPRSRRSRRRPSHRCRRPAARPAPRQRRRHRSARRLVSIVFADIVGSTGLAERLDPESMHGLLDRYSDVCSAVIERHGGTVEGFIGDAVVGVFGLAELHEDDALRAVRAAVELREAGAALSAELERERGVRLGMKLGVESGRGVRQRRRAARRASPPGDAFNVAARLEGDRARGRDPARRERPPPGSGRRAGRAAGAARPEGADGEGAGVAAARPGGRGLGAAPVAREPLRRARARAGRASRRLRRVRATKRALPCGDRRRARPGSASRASRRSSSPSCGDDATVVVGRCLSYGEGVTYRPLAEIVRQLGGSDPRQWVDELLDGDEAVARLVLGAIGLSDGAAQAEETFWAVRRLFERVASERPLVVVVEDVHWAEPTLLDLLEYLVAFSSGHAILLVCLARPELLEARPAWGAPLPNRSLLVLDALSDADARQLVEIAGAGDLGSAHRGADRGDGRGQPALPRAARGRGSGERRPRRCRRASRRCSPRASTGSSPASAPLLEHASVQGRSFYVGAVEELLPEERARRPRRTWSRSSRSS